LLTRLCRPRAQAFAKLLLTPFALTFAAHLLHLLKFLLMQLILSFVGSTASAAKV
jgi:hypothetical protein